MFDKSKCNCECKPSANWSREWRTHDRLHPACISLETCPTVLLAVLCSGAWSSCKNGQNRESSQRFVMIFHNPLLASYVPCSRSPKLASKHLPSAVSAFFFFSFFLFFQSQRWLDKLNQEHQHKLNKQAAAGSVDGPL